MALNLFISCPKSSNVVKKVWQKTITSFRLGEKNIHICAQNRNSTLNNENGSTNTFPDQNPPMENLVKLKNRLLDGPNLKDFFKNEHLKDQENIPEEDVVPYLQDVNRYLKYYLTYEFKLNNLDMDLRGKCILKCMAAR